MAYYKTINAEGFETFCEGSAVPDGATEFATHEDWQAAVDAAREAAFAALPAAPISVSSAQAKIQLLRTPGSADGKTLLDDVKASVESAGGEVAIWFEDARVWERANPYVAQLGKSLKLKVADIDALFAAAAQIAA